MLLSLHIEIVFAAIPPYPDSTSAVIHPYSGIRGQASITLAQIFSTWRHIP